MQEPVPGVPVRSEQLVPEQELVRALELVQDRGRDLDPGPDRDQIRHPDPESGSGLV